MTRFRRAAFTATSTADEGEEKLAAFAAALTSFPSAPGRSLRVWLPLRLTFANPGNSVSTPLRTLKSSAVPSSRITTKYRYPFSGSCRTWNPRGAPRPIFRDASGCARNTLATASRASPSRYRHSFASFRTPEKYPIISCGVANVAPPSRGGIVTGAHARSSPRIGARRARSPGRGRAGVATALAARGESARDALRCPRESASRALFRHATAGVAIVAAARRRTALTSRKAQAAGARVIIQFINFSSALLSGARGLTDEPLF